MRRSPYKIFGSVAMIVTISVILVAVYAGMSVAVGWLCGINSAACILMIVDKTLAVRHCRRVPEVILYVVALLGGALGILITQNLIRHKTIKSSFNIVLWIIVLVQVSVVAIMIAIATHSMSW